MPIPKSDKTVATSDRWIQAHRFGKELRLSPDEGNVGFELEATANSQPRQSIWLASTREDDVRQLTSGEARDLMPRWSPDSHAILFVSDRRAGTPQVFLASRDGRAEQQITEFPQGVISTKWATDGTEILVAADVNTDPTTRNTHLFKIPAEGGEPEEITRGRYNAFEPVWSRDCNQIVFCKTCGDDAEKMVELWITHSDGSTFRRLTERFVDITMPSWAPNDHSVAFYANTPDNPAMRLWVTDLKSTKTSMLCRGSLEVARFPYTRPTPPVWSANSRHLMFILASKGKGELATVDLTTGDVQTIYSGDGEIIAFDAHEHLVAYVEEFSPHASRLCCGDWRGATPRELVSITT
jgi:Tol biopolymer transport system component